MGFRAIASGIEALRAAPCLAARCAARDISTRSCAKRSARGPAARRRRDAPSFSSLNLTLLLMGALMAPHAYLVAGTPGLETNDSGGRPAFARFDRIQRQWVSRRRVLRQKAIND